MKVISCCITLILLCCLGGCGAPLAHTEKPILTGKRIELHCVQATGIYDRGLLELHLKLRFHAPSESPVKIYREWTALNVSPVESFVERVPQAVTGWRPSLEQLENDAFVVPGGTDREIEWVVRNWAAMGPEGLVKGIIHAKIKYHFGDTESNTTETPVTITVKSKALLSRDFNFLYAKSRARIRIVGSDVNSEPDTFSDYPGRVPTSTWGCYMVLDSICGSHATSTASFHRQAGPQKGHSPTVIFSSL